MVSENIKPILYNFTLFIIATLVLINEMYITHNEIPIDMLKILDAYRIFKIQNPIACYVVPKDSEFQMSIRLSKHFGIFYIKLMFKIENMNESFPLCTSRINSLGNIWIDSKIYENVFSKISKEKGLELYLPVRTVPKENLLNFINKILLSEIENPVTGIYFKIIYVGNTSNYMINENEIKEIMRKNVENFGLDSYPNYTPYVFIKQIVFL